MPDRTDVLSLLHTYQFIFLLAALAVFAVLLVYFDGFCRAMEPRRGTLEWIRMYDRPALSLTGRRFALSGGDYAPLMLLTSASAGLIAFGVVMLVRGGCAALSDVLLCPDALLTGASGCSIFTGLSIVPCYLLLRAVFGRRSVAVCGALLLALSLAASGAAPSFSVPCMLLAMLAFFRFLTASPDGRRLPWLLVSAVLFWAAVWCDRISLWFGLGFAAALLLSLVRRVRRGEMRAGAAVLSVLVLAVFSAVCAAAIRLPAAIFERDMAFPNLLVQGSFWRLVLVRTFSFRIWIDPLGLLGVSLLQPLLFWGGLLAMLTAAAAVFTRHDGAALFVWIFYLAGMVVWVFSGSGLGAAVSVLALGYVWSGYLSRGRRAAAYGYCGVCLALSAALPVLMLLIL